MFGNSQNKRTFASQNETRVFQTNGGFVYRLGRMPLTHQRAVRFCYPLRKEISMRSLFLFPHPTNKRHHHSIHEELNHQYASRTIRTSSIGTPKRHKPNKRERSIPKNLLIKYTNHLTNPWVGATSMTNFTVGAPCSEGPILQSSPYRIMTPKSSFM